MKQNRRGSLTEAPASGIARTRAASAGGSSPDEPSVLPAPATPERIGEIAWRRKGTKDQIRDAEEGCDPEEPDGKIDAAQLVVEGDRPRPPKQQVTGFAEQSAEGGVASGERHDRERGQEPAAGHERGAEEGGLPRRRFVLDVEGGPPPPENRGDHEVAGRLLEVEPLEQVEERERE